VPLGNNLLRKPQLKFLKDDFDFFVEGDPDSRSTGEGGTGNVMPGCTYRKLKLNTRNQLHEHLANDVLPAILEMVLVRTAIAEN
jgi:hypothetical protein